MEERKAVSNGKIKNLFKYNPVFLKEWKLNNYNYTNNNITGEPIYTRDTWALCKHNIHLIKLQSSGERSEEAEQFKKNITPVCLTKMYSSLNKGLKMVLVV